MQGVLHRPRDAGACVPSGLLHADLALHAAMSAPAPAAHAGGRSPRCSCRASALRVVDARMTHSDSRVSRSTAGKAIRAGTCIRLPQAAIKRGQVPAPINSRDVNLVLHEVNHPRAQLQVVVAEQVLQPLHVHPAVPQGSIVALGHLKVGCSHSASLSLGCLFTRTRSFDTRGSAAQASLSIKRQSRTMRLTVDECAALALPWWAIHLARLAHLRWQLGHPPTPHGPCRRLCLHG